MLNKLYKDKKWLKKQYCKLKLPTIDIARKTNSSCGVIMYWCRKFGLKRRRLRSSSRYIINEHYFSKIDNEEKAYWLGFIAADGCVVYEKGNKRFVINLASKDKNHLLKLRKHVGYSGPIYYDRISNGNNYCTLQIACEKFVENLIKLGIVPRKTHILERPNISIRLIRHWVRGVFDGDGSVSYCRDGNIRGEFCGTKDVIGFIQENIPLFGVISKRNNCETRYCSFNGNIIAKRIYNYMYKRSKIFLERKRKVFLNVV